MHFWQALVNTALLGTDKKSVDTAGLPDALRLVAEKMPAADREAQLLKIAALTTQYIRVGLGPRKLVLPALPVCAPETAAYGPSPAIRLLGPLLDGGQPGVTLLEYWLDRCLHKGWVVPPDHLIPLLDAGTEKKYHFLRDKIQKVAGKRGRWLAHLNEKWAYALVADTDAERSWQEGRPAQRKEVFKAVRERDPSKALGWLEAAWSQESANDRKELLQLLRVNLNRADEAFLESRRQEVLALGSKAKPVHLEIKALTTQLLLSLPDAALSREVWERVKLYFEQNRTFIPLDGKAAVNLALPEGEDAFLNPQVMHEQFGFDKSSPLPEYTDAKYWLNELIRYIPPVRWGQYFGEEAAWVRSVFNGPQGGFRSSRAKGTHPLFATSLSDAIYLHRDPAWASAWLKVFPQGVPGEGQRQVYRLCELLPQAELEQFVSGHVDQPAALADVLTSPRLSRWSLSFTHYVLKSIRQSADDYYRLQQGQNLLERAVLHLPDEIVKELDRYGQAPAGEGYALRQWTDRIEAPLVRLLQLRQEIEKL